MIKRLVKMTFKPEYVPIFVALFHSKKELIVAVKGCSHVELLHDLENTCVFFTYSLWENTNYLDAYRDSELFKTVWSETKILFDAKPEAWSLNVSNLTKQAPKVPL